MKNKLISRNYFTRKRIPRNFENFHKTLFDCNYFLVENYIIFYGKLNLNLSLFSKENIYYFMENDIFLWVGIILFFTILKKNMKNDIF